MRIIVPWRQQKRLQGLHFRKHRKAMAGNFIPGLGSNDLIEMFRTQLEADILKGVREEDKLISVTYEAREFIGWQGFVEKQTFDVDLIESFQPNKRSHALRYKPGQGPAAPLTRDVTFIISIPRHPDDPTLIQSMYPGRDIGELKGYISAREFIIFFDFDHAGEALVDA